MDDFEEFREQLVMGLLLLAAAQHSKNPEDQYQTARDFLDAIKSGDFKFTPDEGLKGMLGRALRQDPKKWGSD